MLKNKLNSISSSPDYDAYAAAAVYGLVETGRVQDAIAVGDKIRDIKFRSSALKSAAFEWALTTPGKAIEWSNARNEDSDEVKAAIASGIVGGWFQHNTLECSEWVKSLPDGLTKDHAASTLANRLVRNSPDEAAVWANSIKDPVIKNDAVKFVKERAY